MNILLQIICIILFIGPLKGTNNYSSRNCKYCKHFVKPIMKETIYIGDYFGKCKKFFNINYGSNELNYKYALHSRSCDSSCGLEGKYFEPNNSTNSDDGYLD